MNASNKHWANGHHLFWLYGEGGLAGIIVGQEVVACSTGGWCHYGNLHEVT